MNKLKVLYLKEFKQLVYSYTGFFSLLLFPVFLSVWMIFVIHIFNSVQADLSGFFSLFPILNILFIPILSLKLWADENRMGTKEITLSLPFSEWQIVLSRYLAVSTLISISFVFTMIFPMALNSLGNFDLGKIVSNYIGLFLSVSSSIALCMFISSVVSGTIVSWLLSMVFLIILNGTMFSSNLLSNLAFPGHMESFSRGILNFSDILYFLIITIFFLYLSKKILFLRRWN